ncbi:MAG: hypothetical protein AABY22_11655 [Nanoarchaeota archaeon]
MGIVKDFRFSASSKEKHRKTYRTKGFMLIDTKKTKIISLEDFLSQFFYEKRSPSSIINPMPISQPNSQTSQFRQLEVAVYIVKKILRPEGFFFKEIPKTITEIEKELGYKVSIGSFYNTLKRLLSLGLIKRQHGTYTASTIYNERLKDSSDYWKAMQDIRDEEIKKIEIKEKNEK